MNKKPLWLKERDRVRDHGTTLDQFNPDITRGGEGVPISRARQQNNPDSQGVGPKGIP